MVLLVLETEMVKSVFMHFSLPAVVPVEDFNWGQYICSNNLVGAPVSCFKHVSVFQKQEVQLCLLQPF